MKLLLLITIKIIFSLILNYLLIKIKNLLLKLLINLILILKIKLKFLVIGTLIIFNNINNLFLVIFYFKKII